MLVEHARSSVDIADAVHAEYPDAVGTPVVSLLACSLADTSIDVVLTGGSKIAGAHAGAGTVTERTTCNFGLNPEHAHVASSAGMIVSAVDDTGEVRAVERTDHPFFVGTLYQPQLTSAPGAPHPVLRAFVQAVAG